MGHEAAKLLSYWIRPHLKCTRPSNFSGAYIANNCRTLYDSGSLDTQPVSSDALSNLRLHSCVDLRSFSGFSRGKAVVDGRVIHRRFIMNKALLEQVFLIATLFHDDQPSTLNCPIHGYSTANDQLLNLCI
jgi:hypothetical protein